MNSIFKDGVYDESSTLSDHINRFCDPKTIITNEEVANLIAKYFFNYIDGNAYSVKISEDDIYEKFQAFSDFCRKYHKTKSKNSTSREQRIFSNCSYQLCMLGDLSSTITIFKEIISRQILDIIGNRSYNGVDLGTGTGILLLAQFIQAHRNKLLPSVQKNIGIELCPVVKEYTSDISQTLGFGKVVQGDIRKAGDLGQVQGLLHFVSSENLTNPGNTFGNGLDTKEPLFESWFNLGSQESIRYSSFFPQKVLVGFTDSHLTEKLIDLGNSDHRKDMEDFYLQLQQVGINASSKIFPVKIDIDGSMIYLSDIGRDLEDPKIGIVSQAIQQERRW